MPDASTLMQLAQDNHHSSLSPNGKQSNAFIVKQLASSNNYANNNKQIFNSNGYLVYANNKGVLLAKGMFVILTFELNDSIRNYLSATC